jgi:hypothetical protein
MPYQLSTLNPMLDLLNIRFLCDKRVFVKVF